MIVNGRSPLTVRGLNPGVMYSVNVTVFNYNEVGLSDQTLAQNITVNAGTYENKCCVAVMIENMYITKACICIYFYK